MIVSAGLTLKNIIFDSLDSIIGKYFRYQNLDDENEPCMKMTK